MDYQLIELSKEACQDSYAVFPLIFGFAIEEILAIIGVTALGGIVGALLGIGIAEVSDYCFGTNKKEILKGTKIAILGMKGAGKTQFLKDLQAIPFNKEEDEDTSEDSYESFTASINGKDYKIAAGYDYGGGNTFVKNHWENLIGQNDIIFFIFDVYQYLKDEDYKDQVNARLDFLHRHNCSSSNTAVFGSNVDHFEEKQRKAVVGLTQKIIEGKKYSYFFTSNFYVGDLRRKDDILKMCAKMFDSNISKKEEEEKRRAEKEKNKSNEEKNEETNQKYND